MDRAQLLIAKAAEVTESLLPWATEILEPGEQLVVSFRVQRTPLVVQDADPRSEVTNHYLGLGYMDFFTPARLAEFEPAPSVAGRVYNCLKSETSWLRDRSGKEEPTLEDFLVVYTVAEALRIPNFGRKSILLLQRVLLSVGLSLRDPGGFLRKNT
jgi:hypothetical protein